MKYYVAYGSNLSLDQMKRRCPGAVPVGRGWIEDYEFVYIRHATIRPKAGSRVPVGIWQISAADEKSLDRYEGFPRYYVKDRLDLDMQHLGSDKVSRITGMVYIMNEARLTGNSLIPPTAEYHRIIRDGYADFGFGDETLRLEKALVMADAALWGDPLADT